MSKVRSDNISNRANDGAPKLVFGAEVPVGYGITGAGGINITGIVTATGASFTGNVSVGGTVSATSAAIADLTSGRVVFAGTSGELEDHANLTFDGNMLSVNNFEIGNQIRHKNNTDTRIRFPAFDTFTVETAGVERLRITSDGKMGLGTIDPSTFAGNCTLALNSSGGARIGLNATGRAYYIGADSGSDRLEIGRRISSNSADSADLVLTASGNFGINQTNPTQKLHVVGNVQINGGGLTSLLTSVIADDAYADVVMPVKGGIIVITSFTDYDTYPQPSGTGLVYYDAGTSTGGSVMVDASNSLATSTNTSTTVGTFTDGKTTIAMINSTGSIRIWNRMGDNRKYKITLL